MERQLGDVYDKQTWAGEAGSSPQEVLSDVQVEEYERRRHGTPPRIAQTLGCLDGRGSAH